MLATFMVICAVATVVNLVVGLYLAINYKG